MSQNLCAITHKRSIIVRLSLLGGVALALVALGNTGCEDQKIGLPCDVGSVADNKQNEFNDQALECPSRICLKPAVDLNADMPSIPTTALCSAPCSQDSDCEGQLRDPSNKIPAGEAGADLRCQKGFACGIVFVKSRIACQKLCVCRDFVNRSGVSTPPGC